MAGVYPSCIQEFFLVIYVYKSCLANIEGKFSLLKKCKFSNGGFSEYHRETDL